MTATSSESTLIALSDSLAAATERAARSLVGVNARERLPSSGIVWSESVVVTADHTIEREEGITVLLPDGASASASLVGRDGSTDIAVLRVSDANLTPAAKATAESLAVGHVVLALGRPGHLAASMGVLSVVGPAWRTWAGGEIDTLLRPDLTLYPGFSGGALVDAHGHLAGMVTSGLARSMSLAVPLATIDRVATQILQGGRVARGYLGLGMQPVRLPENLHAVAGNRDSALIIVSIEPGSPAERAGLMVGDILADLDGHAVTDARDVQATLGPKSVDTTINARIIRAGERRDVSITVGERPRRGQ